MWHSIGLALFSLLVVYTMLRQNRIQTDKGVLRTTCDVCIVLIVVGVWLLINIK